MQRTEPGLNRSIARFCVALALLVLTGGCDDSADDATAPSGGAVATGTANGGNGAARAGSGSGTSLADDEVEGSFAGGAASNGAAGQGGADGARELSPRQARYHGADTDRSLRFELDMVEGLSPYPSSVEYLGQLFSRVLDKPDGISFDQDETLQTFGEEHVWTFVELDEFARAHAVDDSSGPVRIHVLFVDGRYDSGEDSGTVLGLAWGERHIALFQDAIRSGCSGVLGPLQADTCELAERSVWAHEIGHVIGLVDNGLTQETAHRDPDHGRHDVSEECLMYWAYESPAAFDMLVSRLQTGQSPDVDFCENCWADLRRARR